MKTALILVTLALLNALNFRPTNAEVASTEDEIPLEVVLKDQTLQGVILPDAGVSRKTRAVADALVLSNGVAPLNAGSHPIAAALRKRRSDEVKVGVTSHGLVKCVTNTDCIIPGSVCRCQISPPGCSCGLA